METQQAPVAVKICRLFDYIVHVMVFSTSDIFFDRFLCRREKLSNDEGGFGQKCSILLSYFLLIVLTYIFHRALVAGFSYCYMHGEKSEYAENALGVNLEE
jgi:hypothetical protein